MNTIKGVTAFTSTPDSKSILCRSTGNDNLLLDIFSSSYSENDYFDLNTFQCFSSCGDNHDLDTRIIDFSTNNRLALILDRHGEYEEYENKLYLIDLKEKSKISKNYQKEPIRLSSCKNYIAVVTDDNDILIKNALTNSTIKQLSLESSILSSSYSLSINMIEFSKDGKYLIAMPRRRSGFKLVIFDVEKEKILYEIFKYNSGSISCSQEGFFNASDEIIKEYLRVITDEDACQLNGDEILIKYFGETTPENSRELKEEEIKYFYTENFIDIR